MTREDPVIYLMDPDPKQVSNAMRLSMTDLKMLLLHMRIMMKNVTVKGTAVGLSASRLEEDFRKLPDLKAFAELDKETIARLYVSLCSSLESALKVAEHSPEIRSVWELILNQAEVSSKSVTPLLGRKLVYFEQYADYSYLRFVEPFFSPVRLFDCRGRYDDSDASYMISVSPTVRRYFLERLHGKKVLDFEIKNELPEEEGLEVLNYEGDLTDEMQYLYGRAIAGQFITERGTLTVPRLKKIRASDAIMRFPDRGAKVPMPDRVMLLAYIYSSFLTKNGNKSCEEVENGQSEMMQWAKYVVNDYAKDISANELGVLFPEYTGFTKNLGEEADAGGLTECMVPILKESARVWLGLEKLWLNYLCFPVRAWTVGSVRHLFSVRARGRQSLRPKGAPGGSAFKYPMNWSRDVDFRFIIRWLELLCAAGIVELAYVRDPDPDDICEGLRYVRLTSLGRYAFGVDSDYKGGLGKVGFEYEYDEVNGILTLLTPDSPYRIFLSRIARPIGGSRYSLSAECFVRYSQDAMEAARNLINFKKIVDVEGCPALETLVKDVERRIDCTEKIDEEFVPYRIRRDFPDLASLIMGNPEIRANVVLAEGSMVMVKESFDQRFRSICHDAGYLV